MKVTLGYREFKIKNRTLDLTLDNITQEELTALCDILKTDKRITALYLSENNIGETGAKAIAEALKVNNTLTSLYLSDNNINAAGATAISDALKVNKTLITLDLSHNNIGDEGVKAIDELVIQNKNIIYCFYNNPTSSAKGELDARQVAFRAFVANLAKNEPYTGAISAIQFHWLKNHGSAYYNSVSDQNKISYKDFKTKWQTVVLKSQEQVCYQKFKMNFNLLELDPKMLEGISTVNQHMITKTEPKKLEMPEDIIRHMFNQLTLQEKIDQLSR